MRRRSSSGARRGRVVRGTAARSEGTPRDADRLRQVVANLVGNALVHTPDDAAIEIRVEPRGREAVIEVVDRGPGMAPEVTERAFERFFRADPSRSRHQGGSGLGLAIDQAVVAVHGGRIELVIRVGTGTTVRIILPVAGATPLDTLAEPTLPPAPSSSGHGAAAVARWVAGVARRPLAPLAGQRETLIECLPRPRIEAVGGDPV